MEPHSSSDQMKTTWHPNMQLNSLSSMGHLTPFLIGSYHEIFTCQTNYDESLKNVSQTCYYFLMSLSLIGWINDRILILTNQQVVLMELKIKCTLCPTLRLNEMSHPVDCIFQGSCHKTCMYSIMESWQSMHILWLLVVKYSIYQKWYHV